MNERIRTSNDVLVIGTALKAIETGEEQENVDDVERTDDGGPLTGYQDGRRTRPDADPAQHLAKVVGVTAVQHC